MNPLAELREFFDREDIELPSIRVQTRSGDTDSNTRSRMLRNPPEILITTPESLNLLLSSKGGQGLLQNIDTVILDEIHGVAESKRGVYLMSPLFRSMRLMELSGEILSGYFFEDVPGPQFITPSALRSLGSNAHSVRIFWINGTDPISPCGLGLLESCFNLIQDHKSVYLQREFQS